MPLTETGDPDAPHLMTQVTTTSAPSADSAVTPSIQQALQRKGLLPQQQIVDTGSVDEGSVGAEPVPGSGPTRVLCRPIQLRPQRLSLWTSLRFVGTSTRPSVRWGKPVGVGDPPRTSMGTPS